MSNQVKRLQSFIDKKYPQYVATVIKSGDSSQDGPAMDIDIRIHDGQSTANLGWLLTGTDPEETLQALAALAEIRQHLAECENAILSWTSEQLAKKEEFSQKSPKRNLKSQKPTPEVVQDTEILMDVVLDCDQTADDPVDPANTDDL